MTTKEDPSLSDLGEREIVRRLISEFPSRGYIGPGDDCGAIEFDERLILLSTDTKADDTHFPKAFTPFDKGWTIAAANLSDVAAMGGIPIGFLIAYGIPRDTSFKALRDMQAGIDACLVENSTAFIGADTKENRVMTLSGTAVGIVDKREVLLRKGSKPDDLVCITGPLGGAAIGLDSMKSNLGILLAEGKMRRPVPRINEGRILAKSGAVTSCMDVSDGLSSSLYELLRASGNGFEILAEKIPLHESLDGIDMSIDEKTEIALHSGDEYELLFTVNPDAIDDLKTTFASEATYDLTVIGRVRSDSDVLLIRQSGAKEILPDKGFQHFK